MRSRHRLSKWRLRRGQYYHGRAWTQAHRTWLRTVCGAYPTDATVLGEYLLAIDQLEARIATLDAALQTVANTAPYRVPVGWLRCFRGIDTLTAITLLAELHDIRRFATARALMAYLGLVPSEASSGEKTVRGRITRMGNTLVRRLLVETSWHYQHRPRVGRVLAQRRRGQPAWAIAIAEKAQARLCRRFTCLALRKARPKAAVAVARELVGFIWAMLTHPQVA